MNCVDGFAFAPHWMLSFAFGGYLCFMGWTSIFVFDPIFMIFVVPLITLKMLMP